MTAEQYAQWREMVAMMDMTNGQPRYRVTGNPYCAPLVEGWAHGGNSMANTATEAIAEYQGSWSNSQLFAAPFTPDGPDGPIRWAVYFCCSEVPFLERQ